MGSALLAWIGARTERVALGTAILPIGSRTPALLAQTAATLDMLSGGRVILGLGVSGPQVMEGWHGVPFAKPVTRTRETVEVIRGILRRERKLEYDGESIRLPMPGGTGLGKPLKLMLRPHRAGIPIYVASIGPQNTALTAEIADGWLPFLYSPDQAADVWGPALAAGAASRKLPSPLDVAPMVDCALGDDLVPPPRPVAARDRALRGRHGRAPAQFLQPARVPLRLRRPRQRPIQDLYLDGKKDDAAAAVPDGLVDEICLVGPEARIAERIAAYRDAGVTTLIVSPPVDEEGNPAPDGLEALRRAAS